jgi:hypothetical protein
MSALRKIEITYESMRVRHSRPPTQTDYSDEVSAEQVEQIKKQVAPAIESDEWELVDGPAW